MITLSLQNTVTLVMVAFAYLLVRVVRALPAGGGTKAMSWEVSATVFVVFAMVRVVQNTWGTWAYLAGTETEVYSGYLWFAPLANHSRVFLMLCLYLALLVLSFRRRLGVVERVALYGFMAAGLGIGAFLGYLEGPVRFVARHFTNTAVLDTASFIVLACVLTLLMVRDSVDRYLWTILALFGINSVLSVLFLTTMAWLGSEAAWTPAPWHMHAVRLALALPLVYLAYRRLRLARRGVQVPGLLPSHPPVRSVGIG